MVSSWKLAKLSIGTIGVSFASGSADKQPFLLQGQGQSQQGHRPVAEASDEEWPPPSLCQSRELSGPFLLPRVAIMSPARVDCAAAARLMRVLLCWRRAAKFAIVAYSRAVMWPPSAVNVPSQAGEDDADPRRAAPDPPARSDGMPSIYEGTRIGIMLPTVYCHPTIWTCAFQGPQFGCALQGVVLP